MEMVRVCIPWASVGVVADKRAGHAVRDTPDLLIPDDVVDARFGCRASRALNSRSPINRSPGLFACTPMSNARPSA
jgi:hypothetical protein